MNVSKLDEYVVEVLQKSGWNPERKFNPDSWIEILSEEGYKIHPYAYDILVSLGNISVSEYSTDTHSGATLDFHALNAGSGEFDRLEVYEPATGDKLYPIGECQQYFVYAGVSKKIYLAGGPTKILIVGETVEDYLNNTFKMKFDPIEIEIKID